MKMANIHTEAK